MTPSPPTSSTGIRFGTAYYWEYQQAPDLDRDLDLMVRAGIDTIRVGESVWSTWEPRDGEFALDWLTPVLDGASERGMKALLGTPTYAVPPWLQRKHPELAVVRADGRRVPWGARQEVDFTSPLFRRYAERVIRQVVGRHGGHPAVLGVQLDNEPGLHLIHNEPVFERFRSWLAKRYGDVERLNEEWGLAYWSHRLGSWDELWPPAGNTTPSYDLAWRRFQAELTTEFIAWQAAIVRELVPEDRELTTCLAYQRPALHDVELSEHLTVTSGNAYYLTQDALTRDSPPEITWFATGAAGLFQAADRMYAAKRRRFWVTETNAGSIAGSQLNLPPYDGQLRQAAWALVARGAELISYWHWHTLPYGAETYWGGILGHAMEPGRVYHEIAALGAELARAAGDVTGLTPDADVGFLYSHDSKWALTFQPPLTLDGRNPDHDSYERILATFYQGAADAGRQAAFVTPAQVKRLPTVVAPALYCLSDGTARELEAYARGGGHLVLTFRTGYADEEARARAEIAPGPLRALAGVRYLEYSTLLEPVPLHGLGTRDVARHWADALEPEGAEPLARYDHHHFGRWPAITRHRVGTGTVTYVGTLPGRELTAELFRRQRPTALVTAQSPQVTLHSAVNARGERLWFAHNWSGRESEVTLTAQAREVTGRREPLRPGPLRLAPFDVRVVK
ncbi:beta-galactosidase [Nonomuraea thailandensis]|uniref:Beta-galactosidase n=1 Tax=Nonomuraea thailandensis TaxID=1188745 RepID=A0A9X2GT48_9ACTN|nr:beta-galactosidase [Nonomuraea thailandensis]MCP2360378.1 beta-galactosidase [Nonomuraea thailandensis]